MPIFTFAIVVLLVAILVVFSQDLKKVFKKIFAYKSAQILIPLLLASCLVYAFTNFIQWVIYYYLIAMITIIGSIAQLLPFQAIAEPLVAVVFLSLISVLPVSLIEYIVSKKSYVPYQYTYLTTTIIWIISAMIWIVR